MGFRFAVVPLAAVAVGVAGCSGSGGGKVNPGPNTAVSTSVGGDLVAVRAAVNGSGILAAFRPPRLGRRSCTIQRGGLVKAGTHLIRGVCETRVLRRGRSRVVILSESWNAHDFGGSGGPFRRPGSRRHLRASWFLTVKPSGKISHGAVRGDFPPQLVM
jgi:hypothetical protein